LAKLPPKFPSVMEKPSFIVSFDAKRIVLNTGGWRSNTTKTRMNQTSNVFQLGYRVYQKAGEWFCAHKGQDIPFDQYVLTLER
jgi:hypothetical protein